MKLVDQFTYLGSSISSTKSDVNVRIGKVWASIYMLSIIWKSDLSDKMKRYSLQVVAVSVLLYKYNTWTQTNHAEKKLDENYTRMLYVVLNKSWKKHLTKQQLYSHLTTISQIMQVRRTKPAEYYWRIKDLLATLSYGLLHMCALVYAYR